MSNELVPIQEQSLINFTNDQIDLIKRMYAKNANEDQLALFLYQARRTGLDPLARQIHCVTRWNKSDNRYEVSIQTGIDGYRLIADRTGNAPGQTITFLTRG